MPAHLDTNTNIIGGQDMELGKEGGTWLALKKKGDRNNGEGEKYCIGIILNMSGVTIDNATGRGYIIKNYLQSDRTFFDYTDILDNTLFNGYNFVGVEISKDATVIYHHSNFPNISSRYTGKQIAGFGNSPINNPLKKVTEGTHRFKEIINRNIYGEELEKELLELMKDQTKHLPDTQLEMSNSKDVSSIFVKLQKYGTRTHTLIFIDYNWNMQFVEHTLEEPIDINKFNWKETRINSA
ncbi:transport and Golgi organization protein 2-like [Diorhabda sublineata]|uniref:transport and Golgi organization protein 2-like n=1 Tax=Diorhabda sublineata TaxID=1163346 RepID=UPI0024E0912D|nr:transport and Golgi organization protein 2-like [Diorhabda sublineata]